MDEERNIGPPCTHSDRINNPISVPNSNSGNLDERLASNIKEGIHAKGNQ